MHTHKVTEFKLEAIHIIHVMNSYSDNLSLFSSVLRKMNNPFCSLSPSTAERGIFSAAISEHVLGVWWLLESYEIASWSHTLITK